MIMKKLTYLTLLVAVATILAVIINPNRVKTSATAITTNQASTSQAVSQPSTSSSEAVQLETTIVKAKPGQYKTKDGAQVTVNENQTLKANYQDGSVLTTYADNTYDFKTKDGAEARTYADETYFLTTAKGISLTTYEDGSYQVNLTDGTTLDPSNSTGLASLQSQYNLPRIDNYNKKVKDLVDELNQQ